MDTLDSRFLRIGDCIAIKFKTPGTLRHMLSTGSHVRTEAGRTSAELGESQGRRPAGQTAHHSGKKRRAAGCGQYQRRRRSGGRHRAVAHYGPGHSTDSRWVAQGEKHEFSSHLLKDEAVYTHAFGSPGTYEWVDPVGGDFRVVVVKPVTPKNDKERQAWLDSLSKGAAFEI